MNHPTTTLFVSALDSILCISLLSSLCSRMLRLMLFSASMIEEMERGRGGLEMYEGGRGGLEMYEGGGGGLEVYEVGRGGLEECEWEGLGFFLLERIIHPPHFFLVSALDSILCLLFYMRGRGEGSGCVEGALVGIGEVVETR